MRVTESRPIMVQTWRESYRAALYERDRTRLASRISEAEKALILRGRELFLSKRDDEGEREAIDKALYALRAFRNCLKLHTSDGEAPKDAA